MTTKTDYFHELEKAAKEYSDDLNKVRNRYRRDFHYALWSSIVETNSTFDDDTHADNKEYAKSIIKIVERFNQLRGDWY